MLDAETVKDIVARLKIVSINPVKYATRWYEKPENRRKAFDAANRYHSKRKASSGSHTSREWEGRKALYGYRCAYCHKKLTRLTKDHIVPISKGGTDFIYNIVPSCKHCNLTKHTKDLLDWREFNGLQLPMVMN